MRYWKLGTKWGSNAPDFISLLNSKDIIIWHTSQGNPIKGDIILLANGHTIISLAILKTNIIPASTKPEWENEFTQHGIVFDGGLMYAPATIQKLPENEHFKFKTQDGMCQIHKSDTIKTAFKLLNKYNLNKLMQDFISILKQKGQIVLQGPPGTGKTHTAKEIARSLTKKKNLTEEDIRKHITNSLQLRSSADYTTYTIDSLTQNGVKVRTEGNALYEPKFSEIISAFDRKTWQVGQVTNGNDSYSAAIAKFIDEQIDGDQVKLIQFHPAYSYEDFVRGITIENNGNQIEYITKNRILGEFAHKANQNYLDSKKEGSTLAYENWLSDEWQLFVSSVQEELEARGQYSITPNVHLFEVQDDAFLYTGNAWIKQGGKRMYYTDVLQGFLSNALTRQSYKQLNSISGLAKQHASYYFNVLTKFREFVGTRPAYAHHLVANTELKNYVLIIDEINRANLPSVLGELIYALEYRGEGVQSMYALNGDSTITLPPNLFIIGTMNTADRSVGHIDYAIRRRFAFVDIPPSSEVLDKIEDSAVKGNAKTLFKKVENLFATGNIASDFNASDVQLGHSYFLAKTKDELQLKLDFEIKPLLHEYLKDGILQTSVTIDNNSINTEKFIKDLTW